MGRWMGRWVLRWVDDGWTDGRTDECLDACMQAWTDERMDGWMDGYVQIDSWMIDQQHLYFFFMFIPLCREIFYHKDGSPRSEGETIKDPIFAKTLTEISQNPMSFYNGSIARELAKDIKARGGIITEEDFKNFTVKERQVLKGSMTNDDTLYTTSAPSSGSTMIMMVNILKGGYSI